MGGGTTARVLALLIALTGGGAPAVGSSPAPVVECSKRLERSATRAARARLRVLGRCMAEATACPGALDAVPGAAPDACAALAGGRCRARLAGLERFALRSGRAAAACLATIDADALLDGDLGYSGLAPFCPTVRLRADVPDDALACQAAAVACTAATAIGILAPRVRDVLGRAGISFADTPGCLASTLCGNGTIDGDEECDDGSANSDTRPDGCRTTCMEAACGDGVVDDGEDCDDANQRDGDGCDGECFVEAGVCGNGILDEDEECDDGNHRARDGCDEECVVEDGVCGNGVVEDGEECDDGGATGAGRCDADCRLRDGICGDGVADADEECDEGVRNSDTLPDRCRTDCTEPFCGDDVVDPGHAEECEPAGTLLCTDECAWRLPLGAVGSGRDASLAACQHALLRNGIVAVTRTRAIVGRCVRGVADCTLGSGDATDACLARAARICLHAAARRQQAIAKLAAVTTRHCRAHSTAALLRPDSGLGFAAVAADCPFARAAPPAPSDLITCVFDRARCVGERLVALTVPLARELLDEVDVDPDVRFACVPEPDEAEGSSPSAAFVEMSAGG
jgi:cysteine-rich repeat protein